MSAQASMLAQDELYLKNPAVIACIRGWFLLAEGYRLNVALSLHAIQMVSFHNAKSSAWRGETAQHKDETRMSYKVPLIRSLLL